MLLGNFLSQFKSPIKFSGGNYLSDSRANFNTNGRNRNLFCTFSAKTSVPNGYTTPYTFIIAKSTGGLSVNEGISGLSSGTFSLTAHGNISVNILGTSSATFSCDGITVISCVISGNSNLLLVSNSVASISAVISTYTPELSPENLSAAVWNTSIENGMTSEDLLKLMSAVFIGKTEIINNGDGTAVVSFRDVNDTVNRIVVNMTGSERKNITYNK